MDNFLRDWVRYPLEALAAIVVYGMFAVMPTPAASAAGGFLGRMIGPRLPVTRRALDNLKRAMPEIDDAGRKRIVRAMWDNLGRVVGEYPHIGSIARDAGKGGRVEIVNLEKADPIRADDSPGILISGHLANFELFTLAAVSCGIEYAQFYRAPNNPLVDRLIQMVRRMPAEKQIRKGAEGARQAIRILKQGGILAILIDQKLNDGIAIPFFGIDAMTAPAAVQFGLRFDCPVIPARLERTGGCNFRLTFMDPLDIPDTGDRQQDVRIAMTRVNEMLEEWIRERPEQWFWLHRRWPD